MIVLDPIQEPVSAGAEAGLLPSPRLDTLDGKTIGLWSNRKLNATTLLELICERLQQDSSFEVVHGVYDPGGLMPEDGWGDVASCDAVILANGDCGACSTSGIVNAIELEKRGIPALLVSTTPFAEAVRTSAALRGMPGIAWAIVEHPIASLAEAELRERAVAAAAQFLDLVLEPAAAGLSD